MTPDEAALRERLLGAWELLSWEAVGDDGSREYPLGMHPQGVVVYTPDGTMMTTLGRRDRTPIDGGDLLTGPDDQRLAAFSSFIAYTSRFRMDGGDVIHEVVMSLFPNWVGTAQRRHVQLSADGLSLVLSSDPFLLRGRVSRQVLAWRRIEGH
ncbi:MAG: lipocalin-like domain-containing protein [Chloroflexota bacterium]